MNCADCREPVNETDRINARTCKGCNGGMHAECSMVGLDEEDLCEECFFDQRANYDKAMKAMGAEA